MKKILGDWLLPAAAIGVAILPTISFYYLGQPLMWQCHDYILHPARLAVLEQAFSQGTFIPNWLTNFTFGFGSPAMLFSWFLPYYVAMAFRLLGATLVDSVKLVFLVSNILGGVTIYLLAKQLTKNQWAGAAAVGLFLLSPLRLNWTFTRCSFGETFAQWLVPLVFVFLLSRRRGSGFWLCLTLAALIAGHFLTFLFAVFLLGLWLVVVERDRGQWIKVLASLLGSLVLMAFYIVPSFVEQRYTNYLDVSKRWYQNQFPSLWALINSKWQYGPPQPDRQDYSMSFQIGKLQWIAAILGLMTWLRNRNRVILFLLVTFGLSIFFELRISKSLWDNFGFAQIFTFPWRFQAIAVFAVALLGAFAVSASPGRKFIVGGLFVLLLIFNRHNFYSARGNFASDDYLRNFSFNGGSVEEYLPMWADVIQYDRWYRDQGTPFGEIVRANGPVRVQAAFRGPTTIRLSLTAEKNTEVVLKQYYFPGWAAMVDNRPVPIKEDGGFIRLTIPSGKSEVTLAFEQTPIRRLTMIVSMATLVMFVGVGLWKLRG